MDTKKGNLLHGPPKDGMAPPHETQMGSALSLMVWVSIPIVLQLVLGYFQAVINFVFITSFDDATLLAGLGLGMSFYVVFYSSFLVGMCSTITTFASQLAGMNQIKRSGIYLNAGRMITVVISVPIMLILWFSEDILNAMGQNETTSYHASQFCKGLVPSVILFGFTNIHMYYLNSFHYTRPGLISAIFCVFIQLFFCWLFVDKWEMQVLGCGLALSVSKLFQSIYLWIALYYYDELREALFWPTWDATQWSYVKEFLFLGAPSLAMSFLEILGVELLQPLAGLIGVNSSSAQAITMMIYAGIFIILMGISIAISIFVGRYVGENRIDVARLFAKASIIYCVAVGVLAILIILIWNDSIVSYFTSDATIQKLAIDANYVLCFCAIPVGLLYSCVGTFRGLGKQKVAATIQIVTLFLISLPLGCWMAFTLGWDISGFWIGFLIRTVGAAIIFMVMQYKWFDWEVIARETRDRERALRQKLADQLGIASTNTHLQEERTGNNSNYGALNDISEEENA